MHTVSVFNTFLVICFVYGGGRVTRGQNFGFDPPPPPTRHFQYITMDFVHRGSFNNTDCLRELLNCWEIVKPDVLCLRGALYEAVCGAVRDDCSDQRGASERLEMPLFESFCKPHSYERPT